MQVPRSEADIAALAELVVQGLEQAAEDFPSPPVPAPDLRAKMAAVQVARAAAVTAESAFKQQHALKDEAMDGLAPVPWTGGDLGFDNTPCLHEVKAVGDA